MSFWSGLIEVAFWSGMFEVAFWSGMIEANNEEKRTYSELYVASNLTMLKVSVMLSKAHKC